MNLLVAHLLPHLQKWLDFMPTTSAFTWPANRGPLYPAFLLDEITKGASTSIYDVRKMFGFYVLSWRYLWIKQ